MGYRSDVRIRTTKQGYEIIKNYSKEYLKNKNKEYDLANDVDYFASHKDVTFGWDSVKWYIGYDEVDAIMNSLGKLEEEDIPYHYMRVGESYEDIEEEYFEATNEYIDSLCLIRQIEDEYPNEIE